MSDILCIYYSRTGKTKQAMEEISQALGAELVGITDSVERGGWRGFLRCGMDAMRRETEPLKRFETDRKLEDYRLVIIGTPIWAGRCSSVVRSFLKSYGDILPEVAYVTLRGGENRYEEVYGQMDRYVETPHKMAVSLRSDSVGYCFWQEDFLRQVREFLALEQ
jgi:Flavodoxin